MQKEISYTVIVHLPGETVRIGCYTHADMELAADDLRAEYPTARIQIVNHF